MKIIGFAGKAGSGKTTAAKVLESLDNKFTRVSLADPVKQEVAEFLTKLHVDFKTRHLYGILEDKEEHLAMTPRQYNRALLAVPEFKDFEGLVGSHGFIFTPRKLMQWWGTDYRRKQDETYWVKRGVQIAHRLMDVAQVPVFDDVRFPDEAEMIKKLGGKLYLVRRNDLITSSHASETALDNYEGFDGYFNNYSELWTFKDAVRRQFGK